MINTQYDILIKNGWDGVIPYEDTITMHSASLFQAMNEYAEIISKGKDSEILKLKKAINTKQNDKQ